MNDVVFLQWCVGILLVCALAWAGAFAVLLFRNRDILEPAYRRGGRDGS